MHEDYPFWERESNKHAQWEAFELFDNFEILDSGDRFL